MNAARSAIVVLAGVLAGCTSLHSATEDATRLRGEVPNQLGRILEVRLEGADAPTREALLASLEREFVSRDLFDRVKEVPYEAAQRNAAASTLWITVADARLVEVWDLFELDRGLVARFELAIELRDQRDEQVLEGHVTGLAADTVSEPIVLAQSVRRDELRLSALHDASMKVSRALRRAAFRRGQDAMSNLPRVEFPAGVGPVAIAVLGFDDPSGARRRGHTLTEALQDAFARLGREVEVVPRPDVRRALAKRSPPITSFWNIAPYELDEVSQHLGRGDYFAVGRIDLAGDRVKASCRLLDRRGEEVLREEASAVGLGAVRVVAAKLARHLGTRLAQQP